MGHHQGHLHGLYPCPVPSSSSSGAGARDAEDLACCGACCISHARPAISSSSATDDEIPIKGAFNEVVRRARFTISLPRERERGGGAFPLPPSLTRPFSHSFVFVATSTLSTRDAIRSLVARLIRLRRYRGIYSSATIFTGRRAIPPLRWIFQRRSIGNGGFLAAERAVEQRRVGQGR